MRRENETPAIEIRSDRLVLRPMASEHCPVVIAGLNEWDVVKNLSHPPFPYGPADFETFLGKVDKGFAAGTDLTFAVHVAGAEAVGSIGLHRRADGAETGGAKDEGTDDEAFWEMGYWIAKPSWGRGFATEAGDALLRWFTARHPGERIKASHFDDNPNSGRVLTKLGFVYTGEMLAIHCVARQATVQSRAMTYKPTVEERP